MATRVAFTMAADIGHMWRRGITANAISARRRKRHRRQALSACHDASNRGATCVGITACGGENQASLRATAWRIGVNGAAAAAAPALGGGIAWRKRRLAAASGDHHQSSTARNIGVSRRRMR